MLPYMFVHQSVNLSTGGSHVIVTHDTLELSVQNTLYMTLALVPCTWNLRGSLTMTSTLPLLVTSGGLHWRPVRACSLSLPGLTSGGLSRYGQCKWAVHILLECFPVDYVTVSFPCVFIQCCFIN